jgi:hypothetical protein
VAGNGQWSGVTVDGVGTSVMTLAGSAADLNAFLSSTADPLRFNADASGTPYALTVTAQSVAGNGVVRSAVTSIASITSASQGLLLKGASAVWNLQTQVDLLAMDVGTGGVDILEADGLTVTTVDAFDLTQAGIDADADVTFAQGALPGEKKAFLCLGTVATSTYTVDLATNGITVAGGALAEVNAIDAAGDAAYLEFNGARWFCKDTAGGAAEA